MSCHTSCATCSLSSSFISCLTCPSTSILQGSSCYCSSSWDPLCTSTTTLKPILLSLDTFYSALFPLIMFLYCLKVRLPLSYRTVCALQSLSLLLFSDQLYLYYQNEYSLHLLAKSHGFYGLTYRLQGISIQFLLPIIVLFCCFLVALFAMYYPFKIFKQTYEDFWQYIKDNTVPFLENFYYYGVRIMAFYIGLWIKQPTTSMSDIIPFCILALIVFAIVCKTVYNFHKRLSDQSIYQAQLHLYCMLSPLSFIGLPLVSSSVMLIVVYLAPIALLIMILLLNKDFQVFTKPKIFFYLIETLFPGLTVAFILLPDPINHFILIATIIIAILIIIIETSSLYYSGVNLKRSAKVYPQNQDKGKEIDQPVAVKKISRTVSKKNTYF